MIWLKYDQQVDMDFKLNMQLESDDNNGGSQTNESSHQVNHLDKLDEKEDRLWLHGFEIDKLNDYLKNNPSFDLTKINDIFIYFEKFTDGRGFSLAQTLRSDLNYKHSIWATGDIIPDQYAYLLTCGFSGVQLPEKHPDSKFWLDNLAEIDLAYQPSDTAVVVHENLSRTAILKHRHKS